MSPRRSSPRHADPGAGHEVARPARRRVALVIALAVVLRVVAGCHDGVGPGGRGFPPGGPDPVAGDWAAVSVGDNTTCALDRAGLAYCWGANSGGGLGTGDTAYRVTDPQPVGGAPAPLRAVSVGAGHRCALTTDGRAFCWGANGAGQLGAGPSAGTGPAPVAGGLTFHSISAGLQHTCAVTPEGAAYCWGDNTYAQLGAGPAAPCGAAAERPCRVDVPVPVAGGFRFAQVSAGRWHTCGVTADGIAYCWGSNQDGELGDPAVPVQCGAYLVACLRDAPRPVAGGFGFAQISAGALHTCGITASGAAYCWGLVTGDAAIGAAELGNAAYSGYGGAERGSRVPVPVEGGFTFREVSAGSRGSCGLTVDARAVCWGSNNFGQMGVGSASPDFSTRPRAVLMPAAGSAPALDEDSHACALAAGGRLWCWGGYNFYGEVGSPPVSEPLVRATLRPVPAPVGAPANPNHAATR